MSPEVVDYFTEPGSAVRGELPLKITEASLGVTTLVVRGATQTGAQWYINIGASWSYVSARSVVSWGDDTAVIEQELQQLVGQTIVAFEGPDDLFDPTLVLDSGDRIRMLSSHQDLEPWLLVLTPGWFHVGPLPAEHRLWLQQRNDSG